MGTFTVLKFASFKSQIVFTISHKELQISPVADEANLKCDVGILKIPLEVHGKQNVLTLMGLK